MIGLNGVSEVTVDTSTFVVEVTYDDTKTSVDKMRTALAGGGYTVESETDITFNTPPVADAGPGVTVGEGVLVMLDGSGSSDPNGDALTYQWTQVSGPDVTLSDSTLVQATFTAPEVGPDGADLTFQLTVTDTPGIANTDQVDIRVTDSLETPQPQHTDVTPAEAKQMIDTDDAIIILDVREESEYCLGYIPGALNYPWTSGVLEQAYGNFSATNDVLLVVCKGGSRSDQAAAFLDSKGFENVYVMTGGMLAWEWDTETCGVANTQPVANAGSDQNVMEGAAITLNGSDSYDDSQIATYRWTQTAGPMVLESGISGSVLTVVAPAVGVSGNALTFTLTVTDNGGLTDTDDVVITVGDNGITGFPEDVITFVTSTNKNLGIRMESGGLLSALSVRTPIAQNTPEDMIYGEIDVDIISGGTARFTIFLPEPAPENYQWHEYESADGWAADHTRSVSFNSDRTQTILSVADGGVSDRDGTANGMIRSSSGLGKPTVTTDTDDGGSGGGGCFVMSVFGD